MKLSKKDLHTPFNSKTLEKVFGYIMRGTHAQQVAATQAAVVMDNMAPTPQDFDILALDFVSASPAGAGESMTVDVLVNGASVLTAPFVYDAEAADVLHPLSVDPTKKRIPAGSVVTVARTYVAGAGTMTASLVQLVPAPVSA